MHVGIVHYAAPPLVGGVELTILHHARILTALGHQVTVVAGRGAPFLPGVTYGDVPLAGSSHPDILAAAQSLAAGVIPANFTTLVNILQAELLAWLQPCDVVIGHNLFTLHKNLALTAAVHALIEQRQGPPWVAWHHDFAWLRPQYQPELHPDWPWDLLRQSWRNLRHVTVSSAQQADLAALYQIEASEISVIPPGVEPSEFLRLNPQVARLAAAWGLLEADCTLLLPARITRRKNIELGLRWLAALRERTGWDARLVVTGPPGPHNPTNAAYLQQLLTLRDTLGLEAAAHFVYQAGHLWGQDQAEAPLLLNDDEVAACYMVADALLFPSQQEGFGIPMLEAALARLPIFATDLPPFRESAGEYARLFDPTAPPAEVAEAIAAALAQDRAFQLRRRVRSRFTWQRIVQQHLLPLLVAQKASHAR
jgi:glycosyltransferase involved in cell wall biosynthesis